MSADLADLCALFLSATPPSLRFDKLNAREKEFFNLEDFKVGRKN